jgi:acetate kinase
MNRITYDIPERIPIAISARHVHLSHATIDQLFGVGYKLRVLAPLVQPGQFATDDTVSLVGPHGRLAHVRVLGPPRAADQIEVSRSDEFALGLDAPVRISGDLFGTPGITIEGPAGSVQLKRGTICALRHIHMSPSDAVRLGVQDRDTVEVAVRNGERDTVFGDVVVRVSPNYRLELHLDTDEGNAAGVRPGDTALLLARRRRP